MTKRYFAATDGRITVFRASDTKRYTAASFTTNVDGVVYGPITFSSVAGSYPAIEISKDAYDSLVARKQRRLKSSDRLSTLLNSPRQSWVCAPTRTTPVTDAEVAVYIASALAYDDANPPE